MLLSKAKGWSRIAARFRRLAHQPTLVVFGLAMVGVLLASRLPGAISWSAVAVLSIGCCLTLVRFSNRPWIVLVLASAIPAIAAWRYEVQEARIASDRLHTLCGDTWSPVVVRGSIESTPRWRPNLLQLGDSPQTADLKSDDVWETLLEIDVSAIRDRREWKHSAFGRLQLAVKGRLRDLVPGDRVECMIEWQQINEPTNPGQFDLAAKYRRAGIWVRARSDEAAQIRKFDQPEWWRLDRFLSRVVVAADVAFHRYVPYEQATLASALVLGQRDQVEWAMQESLLATGTIHMLAISGMHIEMVAISIVFVCLLLRVPRHAMLLVTMIIVVAYALLCGGNPPVARAAVLVVALGIARWIGKSTDSFNLLGMAAVIVLLNCPSHWLEIGTQLSFLAVAVLILLQRDASEAGNARDHLDELLLAQGHPIWKALSYLGAYSFELIRTSFWVWLLTCPLVLYRFNILSPIAVILNFVLWIPMLVALLSGLALLAIGPIFPLLAYPVGWICGTSLLVSDWIIQSSEKIPWGHFWLSAPPTWWAVTFYVVVLLVIGLLGFGARTRRWILVFACGWLAIAIVPPLDRRWGPWLPGNRSNAMDCLELTFIDVGHGTSVFIQGPSGETWLYDAGRLGDAQRSYLGIAGVLWNQGTSRIDRLFLSHADSDHFNAIGGLSKRFAIQRLITTQRTIESLSTSLQTTLSGIRRQGIPIELWHQGKIFEDGDFRVEVLHPPQAGVAGSDNANSMSLLLTFAGHRVLLPGDLEGEGTKQLITQPPRPVSILMAPHHGSLAEKPTAMLDWCRPRYVIISGGVRAKNSKVHAAYAAQERDVLITAREHAVRCTIDRFGQLSVQHWQHPGWVDWRRE